MGRHEGKAAREERLRRVIADARVEPRTLTPALCGAPLAQLLLGARTELVYTRVRGDWFDADVELVDDVARALVELGEALALVAPILDPLRLRRVEASLVELARRVRRRRRLDLAIREVRVREEASEGTIVASDLLFTLKQKQRRASQKLKQHKPPVVMLEEAERLVVLASQPIDPSRTLGALAARHLERRVRKLERLASERGGAPKLHERRTSRAITRLAASIAVLVDLAPHQLQDARGAALVAALEPLQSAFDALVGAHTALRFVTRGQKSREDRVHRLETVMREDVVSARRVARRALRRQGPRVVELVRAVWLQSEVRGAPGASASSGAPRSL